MNPSEHKYPIPGLSEPATADDLRMLQQVVKLFRGRLPDGHQPLVESTESNETAADKPKNDFGWTPASMTSGPLPESSEIMVKLTGFMRRFLACSDDQLTVLALWVVHTYCFKAFSATPCLNIYSMERRAGKTTCLHLLRCLCPDPWYAAAPAPITVIRKLLFTRFTVFLDDHHLTFSPSGRQQVVTFLTCGTVDDQSYYANLFGSTVNGYNSFSPRAFAGRGPLPPALADRSIPICLRIAKPSSVKRIRLAEHEDDFELLINLIKRWITDHVDQFLRSDCETCSEELSHMNSHQQEHVGPLLVIADLIGGEWPRQARLALGRIFRDAHNDHMNHCIQALYDVREAFINSRNPERLSTSYLIDYLCRLNYRPWAEWNDGKPITGRALALLLEKFGIAPDKQRIDPIGPVRCYNRKDFLASWRETFEDVEEEACSTSSNGTGTPNGTAELEAG